MNKLLFVVGCKSFFLIFVILYFGIGLGPDEAQYWTWSQDLNFGYYSKPPGIAWQIWLGCQFFGNTELGVRFFAIILGALLSFSVFGLARACRLQKQESFLVALAFTVSPLGMVGSFLSITDGGLALFWTLASLVLVDTLETEKKHPFLLGGVILLGALFKWPIYLFWLLVVFFVGFRGYFGGMILSLFGLVPSLIWNASHDFVTFRHVLATMIGQQKAEVGTAPLASGNFFSFLGAQVSLVSPILFFLLLLGIYQAFLKRHEKKGLFFCALSCLFILGGYLLMACFQKMQGNWCAFIYPTAFTLLPCIEWRKTFWTGILVSLGLMVFAFSIPNLERAGTPIPYRYNPFRHNVGWDRLRETLKSIGYDPKKHFLVADKYQMTSILSFYGPEQKRAYFLNLWGLRFNQFSFWPGLEKEQLGKSGFFVVSENVTSMKERIEPYQKALLPYFKNVEFKGEYPLFEVSDRTVKTALIFYVDTYNGHLPPNPHKF